MLLSDTYRYADAPDPVLDQGRVLGIVRRHYRGCAALTSVDETGGEARTYGIDDNLVLKVQRPHRRRPRTSLEKEFFFLNQLQAYPEIVVPKALGYGREDGIEYILMTRMPGVAALTVSLQGPARARVLLRLGQMLRHLHSVSQPPFHSSPLLPGHRTREEFAATARANLTHAVQAIGQTRDIWPLGISPKELAEKVIANFSAAVDLVALHSNPGPVHTFVLPETLELVGIIDFGDSYISHPALDWRWPTHQDRLAILQGYTAESPVSDEFMTVWRSALVLSDMLTMATRPALRPEAVERLRDLCADFL